MKTSTLTSPFFVCNVVCVSRVKSVQKLNSRRLTCNKRKNKICRFCLQNGYYIIQKIITHYCKTLLKLMLKYYFHTAYLLHKSGLTNCPLNPTNLTSSLFTTSICQRSCLMLSNKSTKVPKNHVPRLYSEQPPVYRNNSWRIPTFTALYFLRRFYSRQEPESTPKSKIKESNQPAAKRGIDYPVSSMGLRKTVECYEANGWMHSRSSVVPLAECLFIDH